MKSGHAPRRQGGEREDRGASALETGRICLLCISVRGKSAVCSYLYRNHERFALRASIGRFSRKCPEVANCSTTYESARSTVSTKHTIYRAMSYLGPMSPGRPVQRQVPAAAAGHIAFLPTTHAYDWQKTKATSAGRGCLARICWARRWGAALAAGQRSRPAGGRFNRE